MPTDIRVRTEAAWEADDRVTFGKPTRKDEFEDTSPILYWHARRTVPRHVAEILGLQRGYRKTVSQETFHATIGKKNVSPSPVRGDEHISIWKLPSGKVCGVTISPHPCYPDELTTHFIV